MKSHRPPGRVRRHRRVGRKSHYEAATRRLSVFEPDPPGDAKTIITVSFHPALTQAAAKIEG